MLLDATSRKCQLVGVISAARCEVRQRAVKVVVGMLCNLLGWIAIGYGADLNGRVTAVRGNEVTIALDSGEIPVAGDPVQFATTGGFPFMGEVVSARQGKVIARLDEGSEGVAVGMGAIISSSGEGLSQDSKKTRSQSRQGGLNDDMGRELSAETVLTPPGRPLESEGLPSRRPAKPGRYETTSVTMVRSSPSMSAPVVDRLSPGTILNVTGSQGEWLVVFSKKRNVTAYVRRDTATFSANQKPRTPVSDESHWREIELRIQETILKWGVLNVQVTFIADTAYLKGNVQTERDRERAEVAARSFNEVHYVTNWIRVSP